MKHNSIVFGRNLATSDTRSGGALKQLREILLPGQQLSA